MPKDWLQKAMPGDVVWIDAGRMSGAACFTGNRVPIQALGEDFLKKRARKRRDPLD